MITITDSAKQRLLTLLKNEETNKSFVRVGVESGGCSGLSYKLSFDNVKNEDDELIEDNEIKLVINKKSVLYLVGTSLEFSDGLNGKGFVFNNPNANRTCGCGESFSNLNNYENNKQTEEELLNEVTSKEYKYGFTTNIEVYY